MNSHYTGYELALNQSRQASIRSEFERQAQLKSYNESRKAGGLTSTRKHSSGLRKVSKALFISLVVAILMLPYSIMGALNPAAAVIYKSEVPESYKAGAFNPDETTPLAVNKPSLDGNYKVRVVVKDIPHLLRFEEPKLNKYLGIWSVSLDDHNTYTASLEDQLVLQGQFEVASNQITFSSSDGTLLCGNNLEEMIGTYSWYPGEQGMQLFVVSDNCYARSLVLSTHFLKLDT